ncbi:MAG: UDP-glucose/GDP-mannose dehydrogenase family protein [Methanomassiliicoccales archaeon]|nr:UDP-glucose/GDP-mannose dehydrogenase family protein [Methanomassiliicoccales archaeon]
MKVSIIGTGYVGLVSGACFAELGHDVVCLDTVREKVENINAGVPPIYEDGLEELLKKHLASGTFRATMDLSAVLSTDMTFVCVGTPSRDDGSIDLQYVLRAAEDLGMMLAQKKGRHVVVVKSTVLPNTTRDLVAPILVERSGKVLGDDLGVAMNPEFLKEGVAVADFLRPDRVVIGASDDRTFQEVASLYRGVDAPILRTDLSTAEMTKMASNAFLAARISLVNELGNISKALGLDFREVAKGVGMDPRIGPLFLRAGCGFGGSCFPKDVKSIRAKAREKGVRTDLLDAILSVNGRQPLHMVELLNGRIRIEGSTVAVLGLAFKPGTDDIREASSLTVVAELLRKGAKVRAYDPQAMENFRRTFPYITYCQSVKECLQGADAALILTEWKEFADPSLYGPMPVVDGRGVTKTINYEGICW